MKKLLLLTKTLLAAVLLCVGQNAWAYGWTDSEGATVGTGEFYLYNVGSQRFMTQGCWWNTHMAADGAGKVITISGSANAYNLHMAGIAAAKYLSGGDYVDTGAASGKTATNDENLQWTFTLVDATSHTYTIKNNGTNKYLHSIDNHTTNTGYSVETGTTIENSNYYWILIPKANRETLTASTTVYPIDATHLVTNPDGEWYVKQENKVWKEYTNGGWSGNFSHNSTNETQYFASFYEIWAGDAATANGTKVGNNWHLNNFDEYNNITGLPNGKYRITMTAGAVQQGTDPEEITGAYIYANSNQTAVTTRGNYNVECTITDGTIRAGMKTVSTTANWVSFDNLRLTYLDPYVSALAIDLPNNGEMAAGQWYKYVVANDAEYTVSATTAGDIKVTEDVLLSEYSGSAIETGTEVNLTAGTYYYKSTSNNTLTIEINDPIQPQRDAIIANKGDITSLINGDFETNADGWTGGNRITGLARSWKSGSVNNAFYERTTDGPLSYTLHNMPAGTYKVVAAARGYDGGQITPQIAGTTGATLNTVGDARSAKSGSEINLNGVEMPYSELGGFTTNSLGHNWKWITATGTLAEAGDLVINFNCVGNSWMPIDDVHLYCTSLGGTSYTRTVGDGKGTINTGTSKVTADIIMENPNTVLRTTGKIITAAGEDMNNDQYNSTQVTKLVLYDGYVFSKISDNVVCNAILYRSIPANTWCTLCVPFWPTTTLTKKYPSSLTDGTLTFSDVDRVTWANVDKPMLVKSTTAISAIEGKIASTSGGGCGNTHSSDLTSGSGAPMQGVYSAGNVPVSDSDNIYYVLGTDNNLHKVTGSEVTIAPFRAYFTLNTSESGSARSVIRLNFDDITGVDNVETAAEAKARDGKFIENGKIVIVKNGVKYNAAGAQVK